MEDRIWTREIGERPLVAVALHHGHDLRPEVRQFVALSDEERLREEDPYTGRWAEVASTRFIVHRSRFEMDLNRPRPKAVYRAPDDAWGLNVWSEPLPRAVADASVAQYDAFYESLKNVLAVWYQESTHR